VYKRVQLKSTFATQWTLIGRSMNNLLNPCVITQQYSSATVSLRFHSGKAKSAARSKFSCPFLKSLGVSNCVTFEIP
jgi:hypothetical protein